MSSLDQAFIKAYKQPEPAIKSVPLETALPAPGVSAEVDGLRDPVESASAAAKLSDLMSVLEQQSHKIIPGQAAAEAAPLSAEQHPPEKNAVAAAAHVSPQTKRKSRSKTSQKEQKTTAQVPRFEELDLPETVYRLDPPAPSVPNSPQSSFFASSPSVENAAPEGNLNLPFEDQGAHASDGSITQRDSANLNSSEDLDTRRFEATAESSGPQESWSLKANPPDLPVLPPSMTDVPNVQLPPKTDLSATGLSLPSTIRVFQPMLQVNHFAWPKVCHRMEATAALELDRLTEALLAIKQQGKKVLAMGGAQRGGGTTTLLLCAARRLVARSVKTVIVDADLGEPQLAKRLGVLPQLGWEDVAAGCQPVEEVLVESLTDNLVVLPVCRPFDVSDISYASQRLMAESLEALRKNYDLVLMDLGPLENPQSFGNIKAGDLNHCIDAAILVHNVAKTQIAETLAVRQALAAAGVAVAGVIENFVPPCP